MADVMRRVTGPGWRSSFTGALANYTAPVGTIGKPDASKTGVVGLGFVEADLPTITVATLNAAIAALSPGGTYAPAGGVRVRPNPAVSTERVVISVDNITIEGVFFDAIAPPAGGGVYLTGSAYKVVATTGLNCTFRYCTVRGNGTSGSSPYSTNKGASWDSGFDTVAKTLFRCDISGSGDGAKVGSGYTMTENYVHHPIKAYDPRQSDESYHCDAVQIASGSGITIRGNAMDDLIGGTQSGTRTIFIKADAGNISDVLVEDNWFNGGAFTVTHGQSYTTPGGTLRTVTNCRFRNNRYGPNFRFGAYDDTAGAHPTDGLSEFSGQVWETTGTTVTQDGKTVYRVAGEPVYPLRLTAP